MAQGRLCTMQRHMDALILARIAALAGDPHRAAMLSALTTGRALSLQELACCAGIPASAACDHLNRLIRAGLLAPRSDGRRRCYRLATPRVVWTLDELWFAAERRRRHES
jgi:DNA-binding transcriptional ArsR family regulator